MKKILLVMLAMFAISCRGLESDHWVNGQPASIKIHKAHWNGIPVYGIPHPSGTVNNDDMGAIALYFKNVL